MPVNVKCREIEIADRNSSMGDPSRGVDDSGLWPMVILTSDVTEGEDGGWIVIGSHYIHLCSQTPSKHAIKLAPGDTTY